MSRIMTYNVRFDTPNDGVRAWKHRKDEVIRLIEQHDPDILGLQEPLINQLDDLDRGLPSYARIGVGRDDGQEKGEFTVTYYRQDRVNLLKVDMFWLSETPKVTGSYGWDARFPRLVVVGHFQMADSKAEFFHYNTHFDHAGQAARLESARLLRETVVAQVQKNRLPAFMTGDFNATLDSEVIQTLLRAEGDLQIVDTHQMAQTAHTWTAGTYVEHFKAIGPLKIDHIFLCQPESAESTISILFDQVIDTNHDGLYPSDHLPILVAFETVPVV